MTLTMTHAAAQGCHLAFLVCQIYKIRSLETRCQNIPQSIWPFLRFDENFNFHFRSFSKLTQNFVFVLIFLWSILPIIVCNIWQPCVMIHMLAKPAVDRRVRGACGRGVGKGVLKVLWCVAKQKGWGKKARLAFMRWKITPRAANLTIKTPKLLSHLLSLGPISCSNSILDLFNARGYPLSREHVFWPPSRSQTYQTFFIGNEEFFRFLLLSLAVVQYTHFFHMLQTLKRNSENWKTGKMKVW